MGDTTPLRRSFGGIVNHPCFYDSSLEKPDNEPVDVWVGNPVPDKFHQPLVVDMVEKATDVSIYNVVNVLCFDDTV
ncbi:hypothetical protein [Desulforamulus profundi]|uniref:hypothetical protein n=1 Tax=Desulforamulus profundi TaxID=1383067 RepID=UPI00308379AA